MLKLTMMSPFLYLVVFLFGLAAGSFLNCVIYRLETGQSFLKGRSFCPKCRHQLKWPDLIPVLSFFILKGKCRYCREKISWQYPLVELATGLIFVLNFLRSDLLGRSDLLIFGFVIIPFLIIIFVYDLKRYLIPDKIIYPAILIVLIYHLLRFDLLGRSNLLASAFGASAFFLAIVLVSRGRWMGVGDIKLAFLMGLILGFPNILVALFLAFMAGAIIGVGLIALGKKSLRSEVPFGPFLVAGTMFALFYGRQMINWYLKFL